LRKALVAIALLLGALGAVAAAPPAPGSALRALSSAREQLLQQFEAVEKHGGRGLALDLTVRLSDDMQELSQERPAGYAAADWNARQQYLASLDAELVAQLVKGQRAAAAASRGLVERLSVSSVDGTWQPYALYVPEPRAARPSLVLLLHGRPQTEVELLSPPYFRQLADSTGTIVAAPYGRSLYDFAEPAATEAYDTLAEVSSAFHVDPSRTFLAGYSMGGFSVFKLGPMHADRWAAMLCVSGAILNSETAAVRQGFQKKPIYVVTGSADDSIPPKYGRMTAAYLQAAGLPVSFYWQERGTHALRSLMPSLTQAWRDMISGVVRRPANVQLDAGLPDRPFPVPDASLRP
jgi:poly(3-hydroxybutyrate) depolymerase